MTTKPQWGEGPWTAEPDREEFRHAGLACLLHRGQLGAWCGYVAVPPGHMLHGKHYGADVPELREAWERRKQSDGDMTLGRAMNALSGRDKASAEVLFDVHGGLTYSDSCQGKICHVPAPGEPDDVWWFGFDCGHLGDLTPSMAALRQNPVFPLSLREAPPRAEVYRDIAYVRAETQRLAEQLAEVGR
jgi:hypothetical protein